MKNMTIEELIVKLNQAKDRKSQCLGKLRIVEREFGDICTHLKNIEEEINLRTTIRKI